MWLRICGVGNPPNSISGARQRDPFHAVYSPCSELGVRYRMFHFLTSFRDILSRMIRTSVASQSLVYWETAVPAFSSSLRSTKLLTAVSTIWNQNKGQAKSVTNITTHKAQKSLVHNCPPHEGHGGRRWCSSCKCRCTGKTWHHGFSARRIVGTGHRWRRKPLSLYARTWRWVARKVPNRRSQIHRAYERCILAAKQLCTNDVVLVKYMELELRGVMDQRYLREVWKDGSEVLPRQVGHKLVSLS